MKKILLLLSLSFIVSQSIAQSPLKKQWDYRYGGANDDITTCFIQTKDGGYMLGGYSKSGIGGDKTQDSTGGTDYWIVKLNALGIKEWDKSFGGTSDDWLFSVQQTADNGYILGGYSSSGISGDKSQAGKGGHDFWILKIDSSGNKQWDKDFGGTGDDRLHTISLTKDGGYIMGGWCMSGIGGDHTEANRGSWDYWIVKTDSLGVKQWDKNFGGTNSDFMYPLFQTSDGGYFAGGISSSGATGDKSQPTFGTYEYWIVKMDSLGNKQWDKDFGGTGHEEMYSAQQTTDGGYILGGWSDSGISGNKSQPTKGNFDYWIVKINSLGIKQWDKDFGGPDYEDEFGRVSQTQDGGYLLGGASYSNIGGDKTEINLNQEQTWVVKTDSLGVLQWQKTIQTYGHDENGFAMQTKDGCYAIANFSDGPSGANKSQPTQGLYDYWIIRFCDSTLNVPTSSFISSDTAFCDESGKCIDFFDQSSGNPVSWKWLFPGAVPDTSSQQNPTGICYSIAGTYAVTLIVSNGSSSDSLTVSPMITVGSAPPNPVLSYSGDTVFCSPAAGYQWYFNGSPIAGATDSFYVALIPGNYAVQITDGLGCSRLSAGVLAGLNETGEDGRIRVYPNPAKDEFWVLGNGLWVGAVTLEIRNVLGEKASGAQVNTQNSQFKTRVDVSSLPSGIYIVELTSGNKILRAKFVKE